MKSARPSGSSTDDFVVAGTTGRIAVVALAAALLVFTVSWTFAAVTARSQPETSLALFRQADALERRAQQLVELSATPQDAKVAQSLAEEAVRRTPVATSALRTLALLSELERDTDRSDRLLVQANRLTRRDHAVQMLLIERAARQGNISAALEHYDIALRTSPGSFDTLAPVLSAALTHDALIEPMAGLFSRDPVWLPLFLEYAIPNTPAADNLARIMLAAPDANAVNRPGAIVQMVERLIADNRPARARQIAFELGRLKDQGLVRDSTFAATPAFPPFDWSYPDEVGFGANQTSDGLEFFAEPGSGGVVARQLLTLAPGAYDLIADGEVENSGADVAWIVRCLESGTRLARLELGKTTGEAKRSVPLRVPPDSCPGQWLELTIARPQGRASVQGRAGSLEVAPVT